MGEEIALSWVLKVKRDVALILEVLDLHSDLHHVFLATMEYMLVECMFVECDEKRKWESAELQMVFNIILRSLYSQ